MAKMGRWKKWIVIVFGSVVASLIGLASFAILSVDRYTNDRIRYELMRIYSGYRVNGVWKPVPQQQEKDLGGWRAKWEKHGYRFVVDGNDIHVMDKGGTQVAIIHDNQSVQIQ